jgi:CRP/FNR family cyclic AMP-dependent transcriptional regulator
VNHRRQPYGVHVDDAAAALAAVPMFAAASERDVRTLADAAFARRLARGQVLFVAGEPSEHLFVVRQGRLKVSVGSEHGDELVLTVVGPGDALGELSVVDRLPRSAGATALDDAEVWCVPAAAVRELLHRSPAVTLAIAEDLAGRVRTLTGAAADLVFLDLPRRLAKLLVGSDGGVADLPQSEVAAQLGVTRQSLNRALGRLQERGWIAVHRTGVDVLDRQALDRFARS